MITKNVCNCINKQSIMKFAEPDKIKGEKFEKYIISKVLTNSDEDCGCAQFHSKRMTSGNQKEIFNTSGTGKIYN